MTNRHDLYNHLGMVLILLLLCAGFALRSGDFLSPGNLSNLLTQTSVSLIVAVGMTFVICAGEIDLSVGSLMALCGMIVALSLRIDPETGLNLPMRVAGAVAGDPAGTWMAAVLWWTAAGATFAAAALAPGFLCGSAAGLVVARFGIPSFIVTLGLMMIYRGAARFLTNAAPVFGMPAPFMQVGSGVFWEIGGFRITYPILIALAVAAAGHVALSRTRFGRHTLAVGGNRRASYLAGVPIGATRFAVFALSGLCAAAAAVVLTSRLFIGDPNMGEGYELDAIAAVIIGGASLFGGRGTVIGTVFGALVIGVLRNGLDFMNVSDHTKQIVIGGMIIFAVLLDYCRRQWRTTDRTGGEA